MSNKVLGIDLGTGNSVVAIWENGKVKVIENVEGNLTTPSVVNFSEEISVGITAKRQVTTKPKETVYEVKRLMGQLFEDEEVQTTVKQVPYSIVKNKNGDVAVEVNDKLYSPPEISAHILRKMKSVADEFTGENITKAVITVPAYFNNQQRQATMDAGKIAGLEVLRIINEPTAAALAFCQEKTFNNSTHLLMVDCGSGTTDISILDVLTVDDDLSVEVVATSGDTHLGGADIDNVLVQWVLDEYKKSDGIDLSQDIIALSRVKEAVERAKIELSSLLQTDINLPYITANASGAKHLNVKLTRAKFESLIDHILIKVFKCIDKALYDSKISKQDISEVVLVGGSTRIPKLQEELKIFFDKEPNKSINPDLAVAIGAALQGATLIGAKNDLLLLDVIPLTLSIETMGNISVPMIEKNTTVPHSKTNEFTTAVDNQPAVTIRIAQGEFKQFSKNKLLGQFDLTGIVPAPKNVPKIQVNFSVDSNSILTVTAKDLASNKENKIVISNSSGMSKEEIAKAMSDFEQHKKDDELFAEKIGFKNKVEGSLLAYEKLKDNSSLDENDKSVLETALTDLKTLLEKVESSSSVESLQTEYQSIVDLLTPVITKTYSSKSENEEVVEGEIVD